MDNRTIEEVRRNETKLINEIKVLEQQCKKQKEVIDMFLNIVNKRKMLLNNPDLLDLYFKIKRCENE